MATELKRINFTTGQFEANGKKYTIEKLISIERYTKFQQFEIEAAFSATFKNLFDTLNNTYELLNKGKLADASVNVYNAMKGVHEISNKEPYVLKYCALFINEENEDRRVITDEMISQKIADWQEEGLPVQDFFTLATNSIPHYIESYMSNFQSSLEEQKKE